MEQEFSRSLSLGNHEIEPRGFTGLLYRWCIASDKSFSIRSFPLGERPGRAVNEEERATRGLPLGAGASYARERPSWRADKRHPPRLKLCRTLHGRRETLDQSRDAASDAIPSKSGFEERRNDRKRPKGVVLRVYYVYGRVHRLRLLLRE